MYICTCKGLFERGQINFRKIYVSKWFLFRRVVSLTRNLRKFLGFVQSYWSEGSFLFLFFPYRSLLLRTNPLSLQMVLFVCLFLCFCLFVFNGLIVFCSFVCLFSFLVKHYSSKSSDYSELVVVSPKTGELKSLL